MKNIISIFASILAVAGYSQEPTSCLLKVSIPCLQFCAAGTYQVDSAYCLSTAVYATGADHSYSWQCSDGSQGTGTITTYTPAAPGVITYTFFAVCDDINGPELVNAIGSVTAVICGQGTPNSVGLQESAYPDMAEPQYFDLFGNPAEKRLGTILIEQRGNVRRKVLITGNL